LYLDTCSLPVEKDRHHTETVESALKIYLFV
jgi:hypothetical protein